MFSSLHLNCSVIPHYNKIRSFTCHIFKILLENHDTLCEYGRFEEVALLFSICRLHLLGRVLSLEDGECSSRSSVTRHPSVRRLQLSCRCQRFYYKAQAVYGMGEMFAKLSFNDLALEHLVKAADFFRQRLDPVSTIDGDGRPLLSSRRLGLRRFEPFRHCCGVVAALGRTVGCDPRLHPSAITSTSFAKSHETMMEKHYGISWCCLVWLRQGLDQDLSETEIVLYMGNDRVDYPPYRLEGIKDEASPLTQSGLLWCNNSECSKKHPRRQPFKTCSACHVPLYCSAECQNAHWSSHRAVCEHFQKIRGGMLCRGETDVLCD